MTDTDEKLKNSYTGIALFMAFIIGTILLSGAYYYMQMANRFDRVMSEMHPEIAIDSLSVKEKVRLLSQTMTLLDDAANSATNATDAADSALLPDNPAPTNAPGAVSAR